MRNEAVGGRVGKKCEGIPRWGGGERPKKQAIKI